ncbi:MAG: DNA-binding protein [Betaproteobacteria bacterium RBG_16_56_24]|nr:MAG: DNA-binding protein [Betaproteobacteria bacterium RBG_16_56_24]
MDRTARLYKIDQLLHERRVVPTAIFLEELGISPATLKRDLDYMKDRLNAPIAWDRARRGYRFTEDAATTKHYSLPGLWFNASEIHALLTMQHLLSTLQPGILAPHIQPLLARLRALLGEGDHSADEIGHRVRILGMAARNTNYQNFEMLGSALVNRKRLIIQHYNRSRDETTVREISPLRLVYYRDNWYLDAWCHLRCELRCFAVDVIRQAALLEKPAKNVANKKLDAALGSGYGIFSGKRTAWAKLKFAPERARWVSAENWHPNQKFSFDKDGNYLLEIPYSDDRELLMDILKYGGDVEVVSPQALRKRVADELRRAHERYISE